MNEKGEKPNIFDIVIAILGSILPIVFGIGGYFYYVDDEAWKNIYEHISIVLYILPICLIIATILNLYRKEIYQRVSIFLILLIGILTSYSALTILRNNDLLIDKDSYISTKVVDILGNLPTQTPYIVTPTVQVESNSDQIDTSLQPNIEQEIINFVDLVNSKIILGLSNSKKYEEDIYSYFCKTTPTARDQVEIFYRGIMRKYCGYGISTFSLPAKYKSVAIIQEPLEIDNGEYIFSQIERWEYTVYAGEKNERIDVIEKLYEYTILEIEEGLYCISNYVYEDPPEDYYLGLETQ